MILSCKDITKSYGTDIILKKINFNLEEHEKAAVSAYGEYALVY